MPGTSTPDAVHQLLEHLDVVALLGHLVEAVAELRRAVGQAHRVVHQPADQDALEGRADLDDVQHAATGRSRSAARAAATGTRRCAPSGSSRRQHPARVVAGRPRISGRPSRCPRTDRSARGPSPPTGSAAWLRTPRAGSVRSSSLGSCGAPGGFAAPCAAHCMYRSVPKRSAKVRTSTMWCAAWSRSEPVVRAARRDSVQGCSSLTGPRPRRPPVAGRTREGHRRRPRGGRPAHRPDAHRRAARGHRRRARPRAGRVTAERPRRAGGHRQRRLTPVARRRSGAADADLVCRGHLHRREQRHHRARQPSARRAADRRPGPRPRLLRHGRDRSPATSSASTS